ncbi:hypothetical protein ACFLWS_02710 [Chloroflexota bacterium]
MGIDMLKDVMWRNSKKWPEQVKESSLVNKKKRSLMIEENDYGELECPVCQAPMAVAPKIRTAICALCETRFKVVRVPAKSEGIMDLSKEALLVKSPIESLDYYAKGYAHLEFIYQVTGVPFDSTHMDRILMHCMNWEMNWEMPAWLMPFLALGMEDVNDIKDKIKEAQNER